MKRKRDDDKRGEAMLGGSRIVIIRGGEEAVDGEGDRNGNSGSDWRWIVSCGGHRGRDCGGKGRSFEGE